MAIKHQRDELTTPRGLLAALQRVFPEFGDDELIRNVESGEGNLHTVMTEFRGSFRSEECTSRQLTDFTVLLAECVAEQDLLENAVGTCFLEALGRKDPLWKLLPPKVKAYIRAH